MANFGLSNPWIAELDEKEGKYRNAFKCNKAINTSVTPNFNEGKLYGDNRLAEALKEFKDANVSLVVDQMPIQAPKVMFGHEVGESGEEISRTGDSSRFVGYGFIATEMYEGVKRFRACLLLKVKFVEGEESYETQGESIAFKTPTLNGTAMGTMKNEWRRKSPYYDTEDEADKWIQVQLGVIEKCETPVASVKGGEYEEEQSVVLVTSTKDATIRYTTDGTTPSATNGTEYTGPISIAKNTGLRAVAYKDGAESSDVMAVEYFIIAV